MKNRNILIIVLLAIGVILYGVVQFGVILPNNAEKEKYVLQQKDPLTHDFNNILKYKNDYMGNASNIINLFYNLPLSDLGIRFELFPETLTLEVDYQGESARIDEEKLKTALIYNSMAAFTLIANLEQINFVFPDGAYRTTRHGFQDEFGSFADILNENSWNEKVQNKLNDKNYVEQAADKLLVKL